MSAGPEVAPTLESIAGYVGKHAAEVKKAGMMHHGDPVVVREEEYKGHKIVIRTTYHIEVDGQPLMGHMDVTNEGQVHSHALPNYTFKSANELVEMLIDTFPGDFTVNEGHSGSGTGAHSMPMGSMAGMKMGGKAKASKAQAGKAGAKSKRAAARKK
jgi:hypothetical protein